MKFISKAARLNIRKSLLKTYRSAVKASYGIQSDVCAIWSVDDVIYWETTHTNGTLTKEQPLEILIRKLVGQNILTLAGIPQKEEDIPTIFLAPFPSLIGSIGFSRFYKLVNNWPGKSMALDIEVVRYRI